jgi:hypothetical protein
MTESQQATLNGIATNSMYEMLRKGQTFKLPSVLANFIANDGWKAVEYLEPETETKKVAQFDCFTDWVTHSPARGGLGSQVHLIAEYITQPMDVDSAPDCTVKLAKAEPALLPKLLKVAKANQETLGGSWTKVVDDLDALAQNPHGGDRRSIKLYSVQVENGAKAPTGNSSAAGLRKLRRYAGSESLCSERGVDQESVSEQYGKTLRGEKSVHRALIDCGLKKKSTASAGLGIDGPADDVAARIIKRLGKAGAAALAAALTNQLTND